MLQEQLLEFYDKTCEIMCAWLNVACSVEHTLLLKIGLFLGVYFWYFRQSTDRSFLFSPSQFNEIGFIWI